MSKASRPYAVWPDRMANQPNPLKMSPGVVSGDHLFITGMTGSAPDGTMPVDPETQFQGAFKKIDAVLNAAGLSFADLVEMTSYHIDIKSHFDLFAHVRSRFVQAPYPAWTAVGVAELRRAGALVEVSATARRQP